jgi:predicted nucleotidyltransferase
MSRILGIVSEYNPFHNGHLYHLEKSKEIVDPDYTVCIMSGNFVQRGNTSLVDNWSKAEMALKNGVDLVIELPTVYSISSAENFAEGAIKILSSFNMPTTISFGSECGDLNVLQNFANIILSEPKEYVSILNHELQNGLSYPKARENALLMYLNDIRKYANILSEPNNLLGIEYLKAIKKLKSNVTPLTIKRIGAEYNSINVGKKYASATAIRQVLCKTKDTSNLKNVVPEETLKILEEKLKYNQLIPSLLTYEKEIIYILRKMTIAQISELQDVTEGLEFKIKDAANSCNNLEDLINTIKSKRYTRTRIQRILLYALFNITKKDISDAYKIVPYIRVLGMNSRGKLLLSRISRINKKIQIVTSLKRYIDACNNKVIKNMLEKDILATNIYTLGYEYDSKANLDYTKKIVII